MPRNCTEAPFLPPVLAPGSVGTLRRALLAWWRRAGRRDPRDKPWMVTAAGRWPEAGEALDLWP
ncbi:MAG: hypothetical protein FJ083_17630, partial [Cyanobacteria bacterium K_Offshore_surface_m2_239]|nr:hypothetical protein [Cyanobacteria bacterium K_Offshore_surface_m2_239]